MGLDMSFYKLGGVSSISSLGEVATSDKFSMEEIKYYRKFNALHGLLNELYLNRGGSDMNCVLFNIGLFEVNYIRKHCLEKTLKPAEGFFWGSQDEVTNEQYAELLDLCFLMEKLIGEGWYIAYCADW